MTNLAWSSEMLTAEHIAAAIEALHRISDLNYPIDPIELGRLRADAQPMLRAVGVEHDALLVVLGEERVVRAELLDELAVARAARIGNDDPVVRALLGTAARKTHRESHQIFLLDD